MLEWVRQTDLQKRHCHSRGEFINTTFQYKNIDAQKTKDIHQNISCQPRQTYSSNKIRFLWIWTSAEYGNADNEVSEAWPNGVSIRS